MPLRVVARKRSQSELPGAAELYERLFAEQGGVCAICGNPPKTRRLHIDHEHSTNRVRGLLCFRCNNALPSWVTTDWLLRAAWYLDSNVEQYAEDYLSSVRREATRGVPELSQPTRETGLR